MVCKLPLALLSHVWVCVCSWRSAGRAVGGIHLMMHLSVSLKTRVNGEALIGKMGWIQHFNKRSHVLKIKIKSWTRLALNVGPAQWCSKMHWKRLFFLLLQPAASFHSVQLMSDAKADDILWDTRVCGDARALSAWRGVWHQQLWKLQTLWI